MNPFDFHFCPLTKSYDTPDEEYGQQHNTVTGLTLRNKDRISPLHFQFESLVVYFPSVFISKNLLKLSYDIPKRSQDVP
jgi:hypothetical protein